MVLLLASKYSQFLSSYAYIIFSPIIQRFARFAYFTGEKVWFCQLVLWCKKSICEKQPFSGFETDYAIVGKKEFWRVLGVQGGFWGLREPGGPKGSITGPLIFYLHFGIDKSQNMRSKRIKFYLSNPFTILLKFKFGSYKLSFDLLLHLNRLEY